ncbi:RNA polymerase sigma factor [Sphingobacterium yanglingense]|uniref:RNA polymerase sigma-70 factor (ECF subfamily) n=1 Tax=Sphingobacterium yanglingense TaxID=1437280 RepID=A0A4R6WHF4_9SPHI|nr:sigma-70 family RNA polymerase sigma factor [Sphingobacterium yanglingense]TDQ79640.1 RNA polymerase sigma-70 factor (ECF subfamily) [Sphingobacterium yanglingense]
MDQVYIDKVLAGDPYAFKYFLTTYKHMAYSVAHSIVKQEHLAEEVVQDAFMRCYQSLATFKKQSKFSTWFYRIVVNCAFSTARRLKPEPVEFSAEEHDVAWDENAFDKLLKKEQEQLIQEALLMIPANEALALRLYYLEELSIQELCDITGWTDSNTKVILFRARKHLYGTLRRLMKEEYYGT